MSIGAVSQKVCLGAAPLVEVEVVDGLPSKAAKRSAWEVIVDGMIDDVVMEGNDDGGKDTRG
jgi:hypothetical protein